MGEIINKYFGGKIWIPIVVIVSVILVVVGLINYIKVFLEESKGGAPSSNKTTSTVQKRSPKSPKPAKAKTKKILPGYVLVIGILLSFTSFALRFLDLMYGIRLSEILQLGFLWEGASLDHLEYEFEMLLFDINAFIATILLFVCFYRQCRRKYWGFWKTIIVYFFTYNIGARVMYSLCLMIGYSWFGSSDSGPMLYIWVVYLYLIIWVLRDKAKNKKSVAV